MTTLNMRLTGPVLLDAEEETNRNLAGKESGYTLDVSIEGKSDASWLIFANSVLDAVSQIPELLA